MRFNRTTHITLTVCSLLLPASLATAQQQSRQAVRPAGHYAHPGSGYRPVSAYDCDHCDRCDACDGYGAGYGAGYGYGGCRHRRAAGINGGRYGYGGNPHYSHCGIGRFLNEYSPYHRCTYAPDHGFAPPAERPIWPASAAYCRMFPPSWTGEKLGLDPRFRHPMVYMPTDTTQLGYYYQHTPFWRARRGMIPPVPHPAEWHTPDHGVVFTGFEDAASHALHGDPHCNVIDHGIPGTPEDGSIGEYLMDGPPAEGAPVPMNSTPPVPYSAEPINPQLVPPAEEEAPPPPGAIAPPIPSQTAPPAGSAAADLEKSAALPLLIPVPRQ